ncbi:hypothetical protein ABZ135_01460 [Streptomyces sp. NPDC006339]|uniref:hypothetical protein n=1 Tax=Streptomyces sp. NPDC006339 TaxID=3156755 RepID=UPI0033B0E0E7
MNQPPLWPDGWETEADEAAVDTRADVIWPLFDHGRPCGGRPIPHHRPIHDVLETL